MRSEVIGHGQQQNIDAVIFGVAKETIHRATRKGRFGQPVRPHMPADDTRHPLTLIFAEAQRPQPLVGQPRAEIIVPEEARAPVVLNRLRRRFTKSCSSAVHFNSSQRSSTVRCARNGSLYCGRARKRLSHTKLGMIGSMSAPSSH